jgi:DNA polymerase bacteriophage-type
VNLFLDLETFSPIPLSSGVHRYAEEAEVLLTAWAVDDGPVEVVEGWPADLPIEQATRIIIHNSHFDRTVLRHQGVELPQDKIHDTLACARAHSLPGALGTLCEIFRIDTDKAKDKAGKQLIQLFCKPRPKNAILERATKETHPEEWARFIEYTRLDIEAMRALYGKLPTWNYTDHIGKPSWRLDQAINDRGFAVDTVLAGNAVTAIGREQKRLAARVEDMTDGAVQSATQRDAMLAHLLGEYGVTLPDLRKGTIERRLDDPELPEPVRELLAMRLDAASASVAKYKKLLAAVSKDGRLRGALEWCGAARTGRWSGRVFQPQNLPRTPDWFDAEEQSQTIGALADDCIDLIHEDAIKRCSYAIRGCIVAPPDKKLVVADLANIEGRMLAWLAGEAWKLRAFAEYDAGIGPDLYKLAYARSFGLDAADVTKDQRQIGKVQELALGYQGAVGAFSSMAALYGVELPEDEVLRIVKAWRKAHPATSGFWYDLERTAREAVQKPRQTFTCRKLRLRCEGAWLRVILPSGRSLCYPSPRVDEDSGALSYMGMNQYSRKWERIATYGGKLVENVTQAAARDVLDEAMPKIEAAGMPIVLTVHDEILTEPTDELRFDKALLCEIIAARPSWADEHLPLAAEGFETHRYRKD